MVGQKIDDSEIPSFTWAVPKVEIDFITSHLKRLLGVDDYRLQREGPASSYPIFDLPRRNLHDIVGDLREIQRLTPIDATAVLPFIFNNGAPPTNFFDGRLLVDIVGTITFTTSVAVDTAKETATQRKKNARLLRQGNKGSKNSRGRNWWESR